MFLPVHGDHPDGLFLVFNIDVALNLSFDVGDGYIVAQIGVHIKTPLDDFPAVEGLLMGVVVYELLNLSGLFSVKIGVLGFLEAFLESFVMGGSEEGAVELVLFWLVGVFVGEVIDGGDAHDTGEHDREEVLEEDVDGVAKLLCAGLVIGGSHSYY